MTRRDILISATLLAWSILSTPILVWFLFIYSPPSTISLSSSGFHSISVVSDTNYALPEVEYVSPSSVLEINTSHNIEVSSSDYTDTDILYKVLPKAVITENGEIVQKVSGEVNISPIDSILSLRPKPIDNYLPIDSLNNPFENYDGKILSKNMLDSTLKSNGLISISLSMPANLKISPIRSPNTFKPQEKEGTEEDIKPDYEEYTISSYGHKITSYYNHLHVNDDFFGIETHTINKPEYVFNIDSLNHRTSSNISIDTYGTVSMIGNFYKLKTPNIRWDLLNLETPYVLVTKEDIRIEVLNDSNINASMSNLDPKIEWARKDTSAIAIKKWKEIDAILREPSSIQVGEHNSSVINSDLINISNEDKGPISEIISSYFYETMQRPFVYSYDDGVRLSGKVKEVEKNGSSLVQTYSEKYGWAACTGLIVLICVSPGTYIFKNLYKKHAV